MLGEVLTATVTPFDADGAVDYERYRELCAYLVDNGSDGVVVNGTTGEASTLSEEERARLGIAAVPSTQAEALDALAADDVLCGALGPVLAESYLAVRRSEWAVYSEGDEAFEQQGHFSKY